MDPGVWCMLVVMQWRVVMQLWLSGSVVLESFRWCVVGAVVWG